MKGWVNNVKKNRFEIDMCNGSIMDKLISFSLPLMVSGILQLAFNAVDIIVVGRFSGSQALAAVGSTTALINVFTNLFIGISLGANVLAARFYAAGKDREMSETVHTSITLALISGIMMAVIGVLLAKWALEIMGTPDDVIGQSALYMRIYFMGMPFFMLYNYGAAILRAIGDTRRPLIFLIISGIANAALNMILVILFHMRVAGVAIGTIISQLISCVLVLTCLYRSEGSYQLRFSKLKINGAYMEQIFQVGVPAGIQSTVINLSNALLQSSVNSFGEITVAGNSAAANIEGFVYVAMNSLYQAAISFTGQNVGAGKYERVNRILYTAEACVIVVGLVLGNGALFFGRQLLSIYTENPAVIDTGMKRMNVIARTYALCGMMDVMVGSLRGLGYSVMPMIVSLIGACGLRLLWIFTFFRMEQFHTVTSLYLTYTWSWIITFSAHVICWIIVRRKLGRQWNS